MSYYSVVSVIHLVCKVNLHVSHPEHSWYTVNLNLPKARLFCCKPSPCSNNSVINLNFQVKAGVFLLCSHTDSVYVTHFTILFLLSKPIKNSWASSSQRLLCIYDNYTETLLFWTSLIWILDVSSKFMNQNCKLSPDKSILINSQLN